MPTIGPATAGLDRRRFLQAVVAGSCGAILNRLAAASDQPTPASGRSQMGLASNCWDIHHKAQVANGRKGDLSDPQVFLEQCRRLGAGGMQAPLGVRDQQYYSNLRRWAEEHGMFIEGSIDLASDRFDVERFEKELLTAKAAGATLVRTVVTPGRRYEQFSSAEQFTASSQRALERLRLVEPIVARHRMRLAVENHKDQRVNERLETLKSISSQYVGLCVDTGNSIALLEDPMQVIEAYAPWAFSIHIKDMAVEEYQDGFLLSEVLLGEGILDLPKVIQTIRAHHPEARFSLEMLTRDSLKVPCLTEKYWATFSDVPATDLARALRYVRAHANRTKPLPRVSHLPLEAQSKLEEENVIKCLRYAAEHLSL